MSEFDGFGALNPVTRTLCGFNPPNTLRMAPSLPAVSMAWRTTSSLFRPSAHRSR